MWYRQNLLIVGYGRFPIDMLRYDACWPASEHDAGLIAQTLEPGHAGAWCVAVEKRTARKKEKAWTPERWRSFGCRVAEVTSAYAACRVRELAKTKGTKPDTCMIEPADLIRHHQ